MHALDKKQQFIELRVEGASLAEVSEKLQVPKSTLWHWNEEQAEHIRRLQLINQDELEAEWLQSREERIDDLHEITMLCHRRLISYFRRHADSLSPKELFLYLNLTRSELDHYRLKPLEPKAEAGAAKPKTVQNGTIPPQNGTAPHSPSRSGILPLSEVLPDLTIGPDPGQSSPEPHPQNSTPTPEPSLECGRLDRSNARTFRSAQTSSENSPQSQTPEPSNVGMNDKTQQPGIAPLSSAELSGGATVQNGTFLPQNGTPSAASNPLDFGLVEKTEQNGTIFPKNGTPRCNNGCSSMAPNSPTDENATKQNAPSTPFAARRPH